jgi:hypothetical protein
VFAASAVLGFGEEFGWKGDGDGFGCPHRGIVKQYRT